MSAIHHGNASVVSSYIFGDYVQQGSASRRSVALTFDDGPNAETLPLLDLLDEYAAKATFFQCGLNVKRNPGIAREVLRRGHTIGNHTYTHARLPPRLGWKLNLRSPANILQELQDTQTLLKEEVGVTPVYFRPPYGKRWFGLGAAQRALGLLGVMWTVIGHDWEWPADRITRYITNRCRSGAIICLHDGRDIQPDPHLADLCTIVRGVLQHLQTLGLACETMPDLLQCDHGSVATDPERSFV